MADGDVAENRDELEDELDGELEEGAEGEQEGGRKGVWKKLPSKLFIIVASVLIAGGGAGAFFMMGEKSADTPAVSDASEKTDSGTEESKEKVASGDAIYFSLDPPFVVNFTGKSRARFLQVSIQGLTRDADVKEDITRHFPQVRNNLVLLLSSKTYDELITQEGKATLRKQVLKEIQKVLEAETGKEGVEEVFFTSFVMQ